MCEKITSVNSLSENCKQKSRPSFHRSKIWSRIELSRLTSQIFYHQNSAILGVGFPLHKPYPYSLYRWGFLYFRYLIFLMILVTDYPGLDHGLYQSLKLFAACWPCTTWQAKVTVGCWSQYWEYHEYQNWIPWEAWVPKYQKVLVEIPAAGLASTDFAFITRNIIFSYEKVHRLVFDVETFGLKLGNYKIPWYDSPSHYLLAARNMFFFYQFNSY